MPRTPPRTGILTVQALALEQLAAAIRLIAEIDIAARRPAIAIARMHATHPFMKIYFLIHNNLRIPSLRADDDILMSARQSTALNESKILFTIIWLPFFGLPRHLICCCASQ